MLLIPKKKEEQTGSTFTETQAKSITYNVEDINSNLYGFFGTLNKRDKKNFLKTKVQHMQLMEQLNKGDDASNNPKKKEADKKWFKIVGIMSKGIGGLFKGVASIAKGLAGKATGILGFLLGIFIILKLGLLKTLIPAALDMLKTLVTGIIEVLPDIIKWAWDILKEWVPKLVNAFADAISDALGLGKESKLRKIMPYLVGIGAGLLALYKVASMFGLGGSLLKGLGSLLGTLFSTLLKGVGKLASSLGPKGLLLGAVLAFTTTAVASMLEAGEQVRLDAQNNLIQLEKDKKASIQWEKRNQDQLRKNYGDDLAKKDKAFRDAQYKSQKEIWEEVEDAGSFKVWKKGFWKAMLGMEPGGKETEELRKKQIEYEKALREQAFKKWGKSRPGMFKKEIEAENKRKEIELKKQAIVEESKKKYFNVWEKQDKTRQKKQISALKEQQKVANSYWEKLKTGANDVWSKMPSVKDVKQSLASNSTIQKMEDFFKPFSQKMSEIFGNIGDVFGAIVDHIMWGLSKAKIFDIDTHGAKTYEEYRSRQIIEKIRSDPKAVARVEDYGKAVASKDQAKIEAASAGMTTNEKELGSLLVQGNDTIGKYAAKLDRFISQELHSKAGSQVAVQKFFPELAPKELTRISPMYTER